MNDDAIRTYLALHRLLLSTSDLRRLLINYRAQECLTLSQRQLQALGLSPKNQQAMQQLPQMVNSPSISKDFERLQSLQASLLSINCPHYPALLKEIADPPALLYLLGNPQLLEKPQIAIVGSRRSSIQGQKNAYHFAKQLAQAGLTITSGLALGIDGAAHRGALAASARSAVPKGTTIGVLGTGIDITYPRTHRALFAQLPEQGVIVSAFPLGTEPKPHHFPIRNRIISGLSLGTLVIEATLKSGSLITARCALEQNREVFALPGSIHNPAARGCHQLIRNGAKLVETTDDIIEELAHWHTPSPATTQPPTKPSELNHDERTVINAMGFDPVSIDDLQQRCQLPLQTLLVNLTTLELKGLLENQGGYYQRLSECV